MIYFTADLHLGHQNIIKYCNRPFQTVKEMNYVLCANWLELVKPEDTVYVLGDFMFNKNVNLRVVSHLTGHKILLRGNHDRGFSDTKLKQFGFEQIIKSPTYIGDYRNENFRKIFIMHAPNQKCNDAINLCGHVHNNWKIKEGFYNVGVDVHDFKPVSLCQIFKEMLSESNARV